MNVEKLLNISFYIGSAPFYWIHSVFTDKYSVKYRKKHHYLQVLAINKLLLYSFMAFIVCFALQTLIIYFNRNLALSIPMELSFYILGGLLTLCLIIWIEGIVAALIGYTPRISLYLRMKLESFAAIWTLVLQLIVLSVIVVALHSSAIASSDVEEAEIVMLYDDMGYIPRWVFTLGFYSESINAINQWGDKSVAISPLNVETIDLALKNSKLLFIASHGFDGYIILEDGIPFGPKNINSNKLSSSLQYVYLSGCDTGLKHEEWENVLKPADVKTFSRLSTTIEHIKWLLIEGPEIINTLE